MMGAEGIVAVLPTAVVLRPWVRVGGGVGEEVEKEAAQGKTNNRGELFKKKKS